MTNKSDTYESWTDLDGAVLRGMGYKYASEGFLTRLAYTGVKCYVRMDGYNEAEAQDAETAETLRNFLESSAIHEFEKGFAKTSMNPLQMKQLLAMIPIVLGVIFGAILLFGGGF